MTPHLSKGQQIIKKFIPAEELANDWTHRMAEEIDDALSDARQEGHACAEEDAAVCGRDLR